MKKITFVTTNKGKIASAKQYLGDLDIQVEPYNHELVEPRSDDIQEIAKQKVLQAYDLVKHPCIAMVTSVGIRIATIRCTIMT